MILQFVVSLMILMCFLVGMAVAAAPWVGLVLYLKRRNGIVEASSCRQPERRCKTGPQMDGKDWLMLIGTLFYLISPLDVLPDVFIGLGWCDDLGLIAFAVRHFYNKFWANKEPEEMPRGPRERVTHHEDDDAIDAEFEVRNLPARRETRIEVRRRT
ncbi:MAG TPA: YkvA family protein [Edaphobacter sp.]|nr:YkvA family protein [Edaphobacter sp.]